MCKNYKCKKCGERLIYSDTMDYETEHEGKEISIELPIFVCESCEVCYFESDLGLEYATE